jgi:exodeoxyribonuclease VIII
MKTEYLNTVNKLMDYGTAGVFYDMPEQDYRSAQAIAGSDAKHILPPKTPAHYAAHMAGETKREQTKAMLLGTMSHLAVLEPNKLDAAFVEKPEGIDFRTKAGKEWREQVGSTPILDQDEARAVRGIRDSIAAHDAAKALLAGCDSEVAMFAEHRTGLWIKGRVDALKVESDNEAVICDVKTTSAGADYGTFSRQAASLNYHVSAAWYCHLAGLNGLPPARFYWIAVEVAPPFAVAVYEIHPDALDLGVAAMNDALDLIARCEDEGVWPGYPTHVSALNLPAWAFGKAVAQ